MRLTQELVIQLRSAIGVLASDGDLIVGGRWSLRTVKLLSQRTIEVEMDDQAGRPAWIMVDGRRITSNLTRFPFDDEPSSGLPPLAVNLATLVDEAASSLDPGGRVTVP